MTTFINNSRLTNEQSRERALVIEGLKQVENGETEDFEDVFCRIESKIMNAVL